MTSLFALFPNQDFEHFIEMIIITKIFFEFLLPPKERRNEYKQ